ncbi:hypothetical protein GCM10027074_54430 [Streptomyces deserti]
MSSGICRPHPSADLARPPAPDGRAIPDGRRPSRPGDGPCRHAPLRQGRRPDSRGRARKCGQQRAEHRLFTAHVPAPGDLRPPWDGAQLLSSPYREAAEQVAHLAIADLDAFLEGYVEGWIPDGWITLG